MEILSQNMRSIFQLLCFGIKLENIKKFIRFISKCLHYFHMNIQVDIIYDRSYFVRSINDFAICYSREMI